VYACDGGVDPAGERAPPWCGAVVGELDHRQVLDPRLDVICRDRMRRPLAYASRRRALDRSPARRLR
jgi:hypothetical protein